MKLFEGSERQATHAMLPVFIPLLLPLTIIAIPAADLVLAIVRRTWNGKSPFAADRGHLHHRLLEIGHSHSRSVLIMYFWSALIAFGAVGYSVHSASLWIVLVIVGLSAVGLVLLLMPRFTPRAPRWAEGFVPPRYRRRTQGDSVNDADDTDDADDAGDAEGSPQGQQGPEGSRMASSGSDCPPVSVGVSGVNGATAIGPRSRFTDRDRADSPR